MMLNRLIKHIRDLLKIIVGGTISLFLRLNKNNNDVWLISERRDEAEDNGYHLYKYIRENHPTLKVFYVIDKKSASYLRIQKYGTVIQHNSLRHYIYYFLAKKHLSAFQFFGVPETPFLWKLEKYGLIKKKKVFLQHGITKERLPFLEYKNTKYQMFVCGAKPEYEYIKAYFGYPLESVKYLGFCRFDNLHDFQTKDQIILMPTWRKWFGMTNENNHFDINDFKQSEYFIKFNSLLSNKTLHEFLDKNNIKFIFYPHPEMQRFIDAFRIDCPNIIIANRKDYNLQDLLKESKLLITDYSSIAFDFAYMKKPLIYYQFDQERYYTTHFQKGYFDCSRDGFGPVIKSEVNLVDMIKKYLFSDVEGGKYFERVKLFFPVYDSENCKRHFEVINGL